VKEPLVQLPLLFISLTMAAYWYRVLRMAQKQRRRTGRAANLVPAEPLGRALRIVWTPVIIAWITLPALAGLGVSPGTVFRPLLTPGVWRWVPAALVTGGFVATRACWRRMGKHWRMGIDPAEQNTLVFNGMFAYVRHPIYALSAGMMVGSAVALPSPVMLTTAALHVGLLLWESAREERHLLAVHGEAYADYRRHVGRLLPLRLQPYRPAGQLQA
jgi:protein-S-isoprenylcysteine O-methyltransferase Ste14